MSRRGTANGDGQENGRTHQRGARENLHTTAVLAGESLLVVGALVVLFYVLGWLWVALLPVLLALLLSTLIWPLAAFLRAHGWYPTVAAATVTTLLVSGIVGAVVLIVVPVAGQARQVADGVASGLTSIRDWAEGPPLNIGADELGSAVYGVLAQIQDRASEVAAAVLGGLGAVSTGLLTAVVTVVLLFFFVKDGPRFLPWIAHQVGPGAAARHAAELGNRGYHALGNFMRAQAIVGLIDAFVIGLALLIIGVPLVLPLTVLTYLAAFVPIVGAFVAGGVAVLVALAANGPTAALIVLIVVIVEQQLEGNVLEPLVQGRSQRLHPAIVLLAVVVGGSAAGVIGALLAVPTASLIAVTWRYVREQSDRGLAPPPPG